MYNYYVYAKNSRIYSDKKKRLIKIQIIMTQFVNFCVECETFIDYNSIFKVSLF